MYRNRIIISDKFKSRVLKTLHSRHPGIVRMKILARKHVYYIIVDKLIKEYVKSCHECALSFKNPSKVEPLS